MTNDHVVRLRALLDDMEHGRASSADAASRARTMQFPGLPPKTTGKKMADAAEGDLPPVPPEGGFHEVEQAFIQGRITLAQYRVLAEAVASQGSGLDSSQPRG